MFVVNEIFKIFNKLTLMLEMVFIILVLSSCSKKPVYTLYLINNGNEKEKIAEFYQKGNGEEDCEMLKKVWSKNYTNVWCIKN